ncbi:MAG: protein kinase domain-containing protein [Bacillota bacterium]
MYKNGDVLYNKVETSPIGSGGNAKVFKAKTTNGEILALKELKTGGRNFNKKKERFNLEIKIVKKIQSELNGIIPIIDFALPDEEGKYWYTMPIAQPLNEKLSKEAGIEEIAECIIQLANVMSKIHDRDIVHRDIKPSNIYWYNGNYCFGDFGLVDYPDKENLTATRESVGPRNTIAPEMKNDAKNSDGKKADVYSLAKTLWMLLTKSPYGFEGTYDESSNIMGLNRFFPNQHLVELNSLLYDSTREEPELRPPMREFSGRLSEWLSVRADFEKSNLSQWRYIQNKLFKDFIPDTAIWTDINDIVNVLNLLGSMPSLNHMFIPTGGGLDLRNVRLSYEDGCIEIDALEKYVLKPKRLIVENIAKDYIWSYFRLELAELKPIIPDEINRDYERLTDDSQGNYLSWICGNYGYYEDGTPLPENYKMVSRYLKGSFVMFSKSSIYNEITGTYDARHNKFSSEQFRKYVEFLRVTFLSIPEELFYELCNKDPFEIEDKEMENRKVNEFRRRRNIQKISKKFIAENITKFNFHSLFINSPSVNGIIAYLFKYIENGDKLWDRKEFYLNKDGRFKSNIQKNDDNLYIIYSEEDAVNFMEQCNQFLKKECQNNGIEYINDFRAFNVEGKRIGPPEHLFTRAELKNLLINGNDHVNNTLVVNNKGYLELLENHSFNDFELIKYPVRHEGFQAFNNYVGKYSNLYHFEETYITSLQGWLMYLQRGGTVYLDYVRENREEKLLLKEILSFYK